MRIPQPVYHASEDEDGMTFLGTVCDGGEWSDMYTKSNTVTVRWGEHPAQTSTNELHYAHMLGGVQRIAAKLAGY